jgi:hypothetical protein
MLAGIAVRKRENTGVPIDSSSDAQAVILSKKEWTSLGGISGRRRRQHSSGVSIYERNANSRVKRLTPIGLRKAIGKCLKEVTRDAVLVCLFR